MGRLDGKRALITGAASGLGRATAELFAAEGARVALSDIDADGVRVAAEEIGARYPGQARGFEHDVTREEAWVRVLAETASWCGGLSILVNNAGIGLIGNIEEVSVEDWRRVNAVDLDSVFLGCKHVLPYLKQSQPAAIVNISSIAGLIANANYAAYNAAKAGVWLLTKSVALHCAKQGLDIRCNSVHPSAIKTPILNIFGPGDDPDAMYARLAAAIPLGRIGEPKDVAYAVLYLASDESRFVTATELKVDGGVSAM